MTQTHTGTVRYLCIDWWVIVDSIPVPVCDYQRIMQFKS